MTKVVKIDSNDTSLRYCQEVSPGVLDVTPANQRWIELEPNSYSDFGGQVQIVARRPINNGRQRKKGVVTNVEASAGFDTDLTQENLQDLLQGFFFADLRRKAEFTGTVTVDGTTDEAFDAAGIDTGYFAGDLIFVSGLALNSGLHLVDNVAAGTLEVAGDLVDEGPTADVSVVCVGFQFGSGEVEIVNSGTAFPYLERTSGTKDLTELGLIPGEWIFLGGDSAATQFAQTANNGFARVRSVVADRITFDKTSDTMVTDAGAGKTIRLFKGRVLKNEVGSTIVRRTYHLERLLGYSNDADPTREQAEYVRGSVPNEFEFQANSADKFMADIQFLGLRHFTRDENVTGADSLLSKVAGVVRVDVEEADAFNTSSDFNRISLRPVSETDGNPEPLFTYSEDLTITINNNNTRNLALGVLGAFEMTKGMFEVGGEINAYFGDVAAVEAVQNNADITVDITVVKSNAGITIDLPLITLGGGLLNVEIDQPIKIPLETEAASAAKVHPTLNHTALMVFYDYLPDAAVPSV